MYQFELESSREERMGGRLMCLLEQLCKSPSLNSKLAGFHTDLKRAWPNGKFGGSSSLNADSYCEDEKQRHVRENSWKSGGK